LIRGQAWAEITSNFAIGKKCRVYAGSASRQEFSAHGQFSQIAIGGTKRELVEQFAAPNLAARIIRGTPLRNSAMFRQNAIGQKHRAVLLQMRTSQQQRDW
jgi:hypothetical protein